MCDFPEANGSEDLFILIDCPHPMSACVQAGVVMN